MNRQPLWGGLLLAFAVAMMVSPTLSMAARVEITHCGQSFRGRGVMVGNLDCTGFGAAAVTIERGRLDMNGFTITGGDTYGVHCFTFCQIKGPGTIQGAGWDGIRADSWVLADKLVVRNNGLNGILGVNISSAGRLILRDSTVTGNGYNGVQADSSAFIRRSMVTGNAEHGIDVGVFDCESSGRAILYRSTSMNNGTDCPDGEVCADVTVCGRLNRPPRLRGRSTCGTSHLRGSGSPGIDFNVCLQD